MQPTSLALVGYAGSKPASVLVCEGVLLTLLGG
jgi:hypothetical protein